MSRVLLITTEPLPLPGWPASGAGLRAWGLAQALRTRGHDVTLLMPEDAIAGFVPSEGAAHPTDQLPPWIGTFDRNRLAGDERLRQCDVIVLQHWGIARQVGEVEVPLAIDLAGPHLLERRLWGSSSPEADLSEKLDALRRADFVTASGERQRLYFMPYLAMAGWDVTPDVSLGNCVLPVIPFSLKADKNPAPARADRFIYGGFLLPWQDPAAALDVVLEELESAGRGELVFIGGAHPHADVSRAKFEDLLGRLGEHAQVRCHGSMSYDDYVGLLREGGIALDLMARNAERELAFTTRTVQYMACGLPVIHDNYSELGELIARHDAGWSLDPADPDGLRALIKSLLHGEIDPSAKGRAAHRCVDEHLDWDRTIEPLERFCAEPFFREGKTATRLAFEDRDRRRAQLEADLEEDRAQLATLRGKRWVRWGAQLFSLRGVFAWPLAALATVIGLLLIPIFWLNDRLGK